MNVKLGRKLNFILILMFPKFQPSILPSFEDSLAPNFKFEVKNGTWPKNYVEKDENFEIQINGGQLLVQGGHFYDS